MRRPPLAGATLLALIAFVSAAPALAYRPFDGTDASVVDPGEAEIELGPVGYLRQSSAHFIVAPALVLNYGIAPGWEAVLQGEAVHPLSVGAGPSALTENFALLKTVLREGALQEKPGPSVALEFGAALPGINTEPGTGGSVDLIVSEQWRGITLHLNINPEITRTGQGELFLDGIIEGPREWAVRPVAELFRDRVFGGTVTNSALIGAIWQVSDHLAFDAGLRGARADGHTSNELRFGLTFAFPLF